MRKLLFVLAVFLCTKLFAFPTSIYWTVCTTDVVPTGSVLIDLSTYFTIFNREGRGQVLPPDVGPTFGVFTCGKWAGEAGFDYIGGADNPWFFNWKVRLDENAFGCSPSFSVGMFYIGTSGRTNFNIVDVVVGKTLRDKSRIFAGAYYGNLRRDRAGFMVAYQKGFCHLKDCDGNAYDKWTLLADYASGRNIIGGGGVGLQYALNSKAAFIFGPTWFNSRFFNGDWKWTFQATFIIPMVKTTSSASAKKDEEKKKEDKMKDKKKDEEKEKKTEAKKTESASTTKAEAPVKKQPAAPKTKSEEKKPQARPQTQ